MWLALLAHAPSRFWQLGQYVSDLSLSLSFSHHLLLLWRRPTLPCARVGLWQGCGGARLGQNWCWNVSRGLFDLQGEKEGLEIWPSDPAAFKQALLPAVCKCQRLNNTAAIDIIRKGDTGAGG